MTYNSPAVNWCKAKLRELCAASVCLWIPLSVYVRLCPHEGTSNEIALAADCVTVPGEMELFIDMERRNQ